MTDQYYGYVKYTLPPSVSQYDNYSSSNDIVDYNPTDWDAESTTIEMMWPWIQIDSDARATALADMWRRVHTLLDNTGRNLRRYTDELAANWTSDASKVFLREIGASLSSIDEWKDAANTNAEGLDVLASTIKYNQGKALGIWNEFVAAIKNPGSVAGSAPAVTTRTVGGGHGYSATSREVEPEDDRKKRLIKEYTAKIKPFVKDLADTYLSVYFNHLTHGSRYKGPTNAAVPVPPTNHPGGPGGRIPPPPILNPPSIPKITPPDPNQLQSQLAGLGVPGYDPDHALTLAGGAVAPPLPPLPEMHLPPAPGPGVVPSMGMPGLPAFPGGPNFRAGGGLSGLDPAEAAQRLGQGQGGMRPQLPGRPNLSGMRPPPGGGARPPMPPGRGNPNLRGSKGRLPGGVHGPDLSEEMPRTGTPRSPMPPRLGGRRGPGGQSGHVGPENERLGGRGNGMPPGQRGAGRAGAPGERLSGRRAPGLPIEEQEAFNRQASRPAIEGRGGASRPAGTSMPEGAGRNPALRGRGGPGSGEQGYRPVRRDQRADHDYHGEATEDELWTVERPNQGGAVIDTPDLPSSPEAGPAIGRS